MRAPTITAEGYESREITSRDLDDALAYVADHLHDEIGTTDHEAPAPKASH